MAPKLLAIVSAFALALALAACGPSPDQDRAQCVDFDKAPDLRIAACTRIIESGQDTTKNLAAALAARGAAYGDKGLYDEMMGDSDRAIQVDSGNAFAFVVRGVAFAQGGDYDRAMEEYNHALARDANNFLAFVNRGNIYEHRHQHERAIEDYDQAIRLNPKFFGAFYNRGDAYRDKGDPVRALADYSQAIRLNPNYAIAFIDRCFLEAKYSHLGSALDDCNEAVRLTGGKDPAALAARAVIYVVTRHFDRAIADFGAAHELRRDNAQYLYGRGEAKRMNGDAIAGESDMSAARRIDPAVGTAVTTAGHPISCTQMP